MKPVANLDPPGIPQVFKKEEPKKIVEPPGISQKEESTESNKSRKTKTKQTQPPGIPVNPPGINQLQGNNPPGINQPTSP